MYQLKYNDNFDGIVDCIVYYNYINDIPNSILSFIKRCSNSQLFESNDVFYCGRCFNKTTFGLYCSRCNIVHKKLECNITVVNDIFDNNFLSIKYYYFYVINGDVFLYEVTESIDIFNKCDVIDCCIKSSDNIFYNKRIDISNVFFISDDGVLNLIDNTFYSYNEVLSSFIFDSDGFIYTGNLDLLKDTIYKYTYIWDCIDYLSNYKINIKSIIYYPIKNKCFEYLVKFKLYRLAFSDFKFNGTFYNSFGVGKEYLSFMVEHNISYDDLRALSLLKTTDYDLIKLVSNDLWLYDYFKNLKSKFNLDILKVINIIDNLCMDIDTLNDYSNYLDLLVKYNISLNDYYVYPNNFYPLYDLMLEFGDKFHSGFERMSNVLELNRYNGYKYVIYPPNSIDSFFDEAKQQSNCLISYVYRYVSGESQIYFMRDKNNLNKSLVTIEVVNNKVVQAYARFNKKPCRNLLKIINKWEKGLIPIDFDSK